MNINLTKIMDVAEKATCLASGTSSDVFKICTLIDDHLRESLEFINENPNFDDQGKVHDFHYQFLINKIIPIVAYVIDNGEVLHYNSEIIDKILDDPEDFYKKSETANFLSSMFSDSVVDGLFSAPASAKYHGNFLGGLFLHSLIVFKTALISSPLYGIRSSDVSFMACMLHDLCKVDKYTWKKDGDGNLIISYDKEAISYYNSIQHGPESVRRILNLWYLNCASNSKFNSDKFVGFGRLNNPVDIFEGGDLREAYYSQEWEQAVAYHMGIFDVGDTETKQFSAITEYNPYVLLLHHSDMIASKVYGL